MDVRELLYYYLAKRIFLFIDEWLFYIMLYRLFQRRYYLPWVIVLIYGIGCIYTSYNNISKIERLLLNEDQAFYAISISDISSAYTKFKELLG